MKKIYSLLLCSGLLTSAIAQQQVPNGSFETWENISYETTSYEAPNSWAPGDVCVSTNLEKKCEVAGTKTTDAASGDFAIKIASDKGFPMVVLGDYPITGNDRPSVFELMAKTALSKEVTFIATAFFHNGELFGGGEPEMIGTSIIEITTSNSTYKKFSNSIQFPTTEPYEFISIILAFDEPDDMTEASFVTVDDLKFVYETETGFSKNSSSRKAISATVVDNQLTFDTTISSYEILGQRGEQLLNGSSQQVDMSSLSSGMYFVKAITADSKVFTYRIFKQ